MSTTYCVRLLSIVLLITVLCGVVKGGIGSGNRKVIDWFPVVGTLPYLVVTIFGSNYIW